MTATLTDAGGLQPSSPVVLSGVTIGQVETLSVVDGGVRVTFQVDADHEVALKSNACVDVATRPSHAELVLVAGDDASPFASGPIPQCSHPFEALIGAGLRALETIEEATRSAGPREAGRRAGEAAREAGEGFGEGVGDFRESGRRVGRALREFEEGLREGTEEPAATP